MKKFIRPFVALVLSSAAGAHAQQLLTTDDGIGLRGTVRLLQSNAATCNVLEANEPSYEEKRVNQDQPLHLWELEFSVFNGSGRALDHLLAYYDIASPWPPCTNWTEHFQLEGEYVYEQVQWVDPSGRIQHTGAATPTLPNQTHTETILLLAFNGVRPQFTDWSVNYTFMEGQAATVVASAAPAASARTTPSGPLCADTTEEACWMELDASPGCYIWNPYPQQIEIDTWSGRCSAGMGTGTGVYSIGDSEDGGVYEFSYVDGEIHGTAVGRNANGDAIEIPYVDGEKHGTQIERYASGRVVESPYVNGELHGTQVDTEASGYMTETPYENGVRHGTQVQTRADGTVSRTNPYVNGELHGTGVYTDDLVVRELPYVNGELHGTVLWTWRGGRVTETPYVNGERHGTEIETRADGTVTETPYENGVRHGTEITTGPDGTVLETKPYVNGEIHGTWVRDWGDGTVTRSRYVNGEMMD